jgi:hypothetical protein
VRLPSGTSSRNRIIQLRSPTQHPRLDRQREQQIEAVKASLNTFDPSQMGPSLAKVARAARKIDSKSFRAQKRRREDDGEGEPDDDPPMLDMPNRRATRL